MYNSRRLVMLFSKDVVDNSAAIDHTLEDYGCMKVFME